jgi:hypothetical protein
MRNGRNVEKQTKSDHVNRIKSDQIKPNQTKSDQKKRSSPDQGAGRWIKTGADEPRFGWSGLDARELWPDERERQRLERL